MLLAGGAVVVAVFAAAASIQVRAAEVRAESYDAAKHTVIVSFEGTILDGDAERYTAVAGPLYRQGVRNIILRLNSNGGNVAAAMELAALLRVSSLVSAAVVASGDTCASACVLVLMGAKRRVVFGGARVGTHSANSHGLETDEAMGGTVHIARVLTAWGVAPDVIGMLVTTRPDKIHWLTADELRRSGVEILK